MKKVVLEFNLPDDQDIPSVDDVKRLTSPDWVADWWHIDDIRGEHEWLTEEQARECLGLISKYHDANIGINWDVIREIVRGNFNKPEGYCFIESAENTFDPKMKYGIQICSDREGNIVDEVLWFESEDEFKDEMQDLKDNDFVFPDLEKESA